MVVALSRRQAALLALALAAISVALGVFKLARREYPLTAVDALNRTVVVPAKPSRVVSVAPSITEIVFALGAQDRLVGVTSFCDYPPQLKKLVESGKIAVVGGWWDPSLEKIVSLSPDLVLLDSGVGYHAELAKRLEEQGIPAYALKKGVTLNEVYENIRAVGELLGCREKAEELIKSMERRLSWVREKVAGREKAGVMYVLWLNPLSTAGGGTFLSEIAEVAGGYNVFSDMQGWPNPSLEEVLARKPDIIVITAGMMKEKPEDILEKLKGDPVWKLVPAVAEGRVYFISGQAENAFLRPGPRLAEAAELLAKMVHPEAFGVKLPLVIGDDYSRYITQLGGELSYRLWLHVPAVMATAGT